MSQKNLVSLSNPNDQHQPHHQSNLPQNIYHQKQFQIYQNHKLKPSQMYRIQLPQEC